MNPASRSSPCRAPSAHATAHAWTDESDSPRSSHPPAGARKIDGDRVVRSAAYACTVGLAFATTLPASHALRATLSSRAGKIAAGLLLAAGGALSAPGEAWLSERTGHRPTPPREPALWHDAISPGALFGVIGAYTRSGLPKFPATSPQGALVSAALSIVGSGLGGAMAEAAAQLSRQDVGVGPTPRAAGAGDARPPGVCEAAAGRAASLLPYAAYLGMAVVRPPQSAPSGRPSLVPLAIATGGWALRNRLTPASAAKPAELDVPVGRPV